MRGAWRALRQALLPLGIPLAWRQLTANRGRFLTALAGAACSAMLMIFQLSVYIALLRVKVDRPILALDAELILVSRDSLNLLTTASFPRTRLLQAAVLADAAEAAPVYIGDATWRSPVDRLRRSTCVFGVEPDHPVFRVPGLQEHREALRREDAVLFDRLTPPSFGPVAEAVAAGGRFGAEVAGRRVQVAGLFTLGPTLGTESFLIAGPQAFFRLFPGRRPDRVDLGALRLRPGADPEAAAARLSRLLPGDVQVFTRAALAGREQAFWQEVSPTGTAILAMMSIALATGAIVVYQILYTDVSEHLPQFATLKAVGLTDRFLHRVVLVEAALMQLMAFPLACGLAEAVFRIVVGQGDLPLRLGPGPLAMIFVGTGLMCGLAGLMATRRLRSADPADSF